MTNAIIRSMQTLSCMEFGMMCARVNSIRIKRRTFQLGQKTVCSITSKRLFGEAIRVVLRFQNEYMRTSIFRLSCFHFPKPPSSFTSLRSSYVSFPAISLTEDAVLSPDSPPSGFITATSVIIRHLKRAGILLTRDAKTRKVLCRHV